MATVTALPDATHSAHVLPGKEALPVLSVDLTAVSSARPAADIVFYHGSNCPDGFAAAFAGWLANPAATFVAVEHPLDESALPAVAGKHVVTVDYAFSPEVTARMVGQAASFLTLDHHASAEKALADLPAAHKVFEMRMSGATLAWCYFHPGAPMPLFFRYLEDKDIWRWAFKGAEAFTAAYSTLPATFEALDKLRGEGAAGVEALIARGESIVAYKDDVRDSHVKRAVPCTLRAAPGFKGRLVNASTLASEIGNALCKENPEETVAVVYCACAPTPNHPAGSPFLCAPWGSLSHTATRARNPPRSVRPQEAPLLRVPALRQRRGGRVHYCQVAGRRWAPARRGLLLRAAGGRARVCGRHRRGRRGGGGRAAREAGAHLTMGCEVVEVLGEPFAVVVYTYLIRLAAGAACGPVVLRLRRRSSLARRPHWPQHWQVWQVGGAGPQAQAVVAPCRRD